MKNFPRNLISVIMLLGNILRIIRILGPVIVVALTTIKVSGIINKQRVKKELEAKRKDAFRALILKKMENAVDVGIFTESENEIEEKYRIKSRKGVSNDIHEGQIILCNC